MEGERQREIGEFFRFRLVFFRVLWRCGLVPVREGERQREIGGFFRFQLGFFLELGRCGLVSVREGEQRSNKKSKLTAVVNHYIGGARIGGPVLELMDVTPLHLPLPLDPHHTSNHPHGVLSEDAAGDLLTSGDLYATVFENTYVAPAGQYSLKNTVLELEFQGVKKQFTMLQESYDQIMHRKYGEDPTTQPYFDVDSWVEAAGPRKKGRVFGLSQHTFVSSSPSSVDVSSTATSNQKRQPDDPLVQEMHVLKNDMQKMSNSLETIQQILQAMTTPHPSPAPSSTSEHPPPISQSAPWNWPGTWWNAPFGWIRPPMNTQCTTAAPSSAPQEASTLEHHASEGDRD